jgi:hypothetical protein
MKSEDVGPKLVVFVGAGVSKAAFPESPLMNDYFSQAVKMVRAELRRVHPNGEILRIARAMVLLDIHGLFHTPNRKAATIAGHLWDRFRNLQVWLSPHADRDFECVCNRYLQSWNTACATGQAGSAGRKENLEEVFLAMEHLPDDALLDRRFRKYAEFERSLFTFFSTLYQRRSASSRGYRFLRRIINSCSRRLRDHERALVVSFNYDAFLDHILYHTIHPPNAASLYGGILPFEIESDTIRAKEPRVTIQPAIWMVKPHGSITWWYSMGGQTSEYACCSIGEDGFFSIPHFDQTCFFHRAKWYQPARWIRPLLIPPRSHKDLVGPCNRSLEATLSGVRSAEEIWILGWSMPTTDEYLISLFRKKVQARQKPVKWLRIVNTQSGRVSVEDRARAVFHSENFEGHWEGFHTWQEWSSR